MTFNQFATNLYISDSSAFGNYNHDIIYNLLKSIDLNFSSCLEIAPFSTCDCYIIYHPQIPMCCKIEEGHFIYLNTSDNYWSQWIYQFAHEYCHHLINGEMTAEMSGLFWFEETICELSSMYHLHILKTQWISDKNPNKLDYASCLQNYLETLLSGSHQQLSSPNHPEWLQSWLPILSKPVYNRDYYNVIASKMYPLFVENPFLWKIIIHFGDTRKWNSLHDLFDHLHAKADKSYADSLKKLSNILFS